MQKNAIENSKLKMADLILKNTHKCAKLQGKYLSHFIKVYHRQTLINDGSLKTEPVRL